MDMFLAGDVPKNIIIQVQCTISASREKTQQCGDKAGKPAGRKQQRKLVQGLCYLDQPRHVWIPLVDKVWVSLVFTASVESVLPQLEFEIWRLCRWTWFVETSPVKQEQLMHDKSSDWEFGNEAGG